MEIDSLGSSYNPVPIELVRYEADLPKEPRIEGAEVAVETGASNTSNSEQAGNSSLPQVTLMNKNDKQGGGSEKGHTNDKYLRESIEKVNKALAESGNKLEYSVHKKTNQIVIKVVDKNTKEVVREVPSEKVLDMVASFMSSAGLLIDEKR